MIEPRQHLRRDVTTEVQQRLLAGDLPVGRINESRLAEELGVSRTPLREALVVMEQRGLLDSAMGRGFLLLPLNREEAQELYPLLAVLEPMAVRLGAQLLVTRAAELDQLLDAMTRASDLEALLRLSARWSTVLVEACPNRRLAHMLRDLHRLSARYERATLNRGFAVADALEKHRRIVAALAIADSETAGALIAQSWNDCLQSLLSWLEPAPTEGKRKPGKRGSPDR